MQDFRKLEVWQRAYNLALDVYQASRRFPNEEMYGLTSQLRRSSISIPVNIAEGRARQTDGEFKQFLSVAMGSGAEVECLLMLARDLKMLTPRTSNHLLDEVAGTRRMLNAVIQRLKRQPSAKSQRPKAKGQ